MRISLLFVPDRCWNHVDCDVDAEGAREGLWDLAWRQAVGVAGQKEAHVHQDTRRHSQQAQKKLGEGGRMKHLVCIQASVWGWPLYSGWRNEFLARKSLGHGLKVTFRQYDSFLTSLKILPRPLQLTFSCYSLTMNLSCNLCFFLDIFLFLVGVIKISSDKTIW